MAKEIEKLDTGQELFSEHSYYRRVAKSGNSNTMVMDGDFSETPTLDDGYVKKYLVSSDAYETEEKVTKTDLEGIIMANPFMIMTIDYHKQLKKEEVIEQLTELYPNTGGKIISKADFKKNIKRIYGHKGEKRTIRGRHYGKKDAGGRIRFIDMDINQDHNLDYDNRSRLVDTRNLNWAIINNVKYIVK